jgi:hypothetical protein
MEEVVAASVADWLQLLGFGALVGTAGQFIRAIAGLKKLSDEVGGAKNVSQSFNTGQFFRAIMFGGTAGLIAAYSLIDSIAAVSAEMVLGIMAAGYAGADFVEAFVTKTLNPAVEAQAAAPVTVLSAPGAAAPGAGASAGEVLG